MTTIAPMYLRNTLDAAAMQHVVNTYRPDQGLDTREMKRQFLSLATPDVLSAANDFKMDGIELRYWPDVHVDRSRTDRRFGGAALKEISQDCGGAYTNNWWTRVRFSNDGTRVCFRYTCSYFLLAHLLHTVALAWQELTVDEIADYSFLLGWERIDLVGEPIWLPRLIIPTEGWERSKTVAEKNKWVKTVAKTMSGFTNESLTSTLLQAVKHEAERAEGSPRFSEDAWLIADPSHSVPVDHDRYSLLSECSRNPQAKPDERISISRGAKAPPETLSFFLNDNVKA